MFCFRNALKVVLDLNVFEQLLCLHLLNSKPNNMNWYYASDLYCDVIEVWLKNVQLRLLSGVKGPFTTADAMCREVCEDIWVRNRKKGGEDDCTVRQSSSWGVTGPGGGHQLGTINPSNHTTWTLPIHSFPGTFPLFFLFFF